MPLSQLGNRKNFIFVYLHTLLYCLHISSYVLYFVATYRIRKNEFKLLALLIIYKVQVDTFVAQIQKYVVNLDEVKNKVPTNGELILNFKILLQCTFFREYIYLLIISVNISSFWELDCVFVHNINMLIIGRSIKCVYAYTFKSLNTFFSISI